MQSLRFASVAVLLAASPGCLVVHDDMDPDVYVVDPPYEPPPVIETALIDPGSILDPEPAVGAGLFIEYEDPGLWHVFTTCDTEYSGYACEWDVVASIPRTLDLELIGEEDLEVEDAVFRIDEGALRLWTLTDLDVDGMLIEAPDAGPVRFDVLLDGWPAPDLVRWIGGGVLQDEAPSTPFELVPATPL